MYLLSGWRDYDFKKAYIEIIPGQPDEYCTQPVTIYPASPNSMQQAPLMKDGDRDFINLSTECGIDGNTHGPYLSLAKLSSFNKILSSSPDI